MSLSLLTVLALLSAAQGQALTLTVGHEPGVVGVTVDWGGRELPFARRGDEWLAVIGVDLDTAPGTHPAPIVVTYADGHAQHRNEAVTVSAGRYPTTELTVEPKYVELSPADQARADRDSRKIAAIYGSISPEMLWTGPFQMPLDGGGPGRNFGHRRVFNGQPRAPHGGADLRASVGTPVRAANRGRVVLAEDLFFSGNAVFLDHGFGLYTVYLHLSEMRKKPGDVVEAGEVLGLAGATGRVTGPHLHWGARILDARVDPFTLPGLGAK
jgi:murein DD-endopeptidase MepM/ murein hydrolase activator NlpD